jgi:mannose-6-phosphate isomerase
MATPTPALYPLLLQRRLVPRIWGGQRLATWLAIPEPRPARLGETWEVFDSNTISNGALAGQTLAQVTEHYGAALIGSQPMARYGGGFPLLTKFLDADDRLSIQVHPDDAYAHAHEAHTGFHGKTEAWYILSAEPGAEIIHGFQQPIDRATFEAALREERLEALVQRVPVSVGDVILVPAGTLHAINAGITLFEIQEKSDLTYRVYDYGRIDASTGLPRALHIDKALDVVSLQPSAQIKRAPLPLDAASGRVLLVACSFFALELWTLTAECQQATQPDSVELLTVLDGTGTLTWAEGMLPLQRGDAVVLPASLGTWLLCPTDNPSDAPTAEPLRVLRSYVPDMQRDIVQPLRAQGVDAAQLRQFE